MKLVFFPLLHDEKESLNTPYLTKLSTTTNSCMASKRTAFPLSTATLALAKQFCKSRDHAIICLFSVFDENPMKTKYIYGVWGAITCELAVAFHQTVVFAPHTKGGGRRRRNRRGGRQTLTP